MSTRSKGSRKPASEKNLFATEAEISNRTAPLYDWKPEDSAPSFSQIPPSSGGGSVNRAPLTRKSGDLKWSGGIGKP